MSVICHYGKNLCYPVSPVRGRRSAPGRGARGAPFPVCVWGLIAPSQGESGPAGVAQVHVTEVGQTLSAVGTPDMLPVQPQGCRHLDRHQDNRQKPPQIPSGLHHLHRSQEVPEIGEKPPPGSPPWGRPGGKRRTRWWRGARPRFASLPAAAGQSNPPRRRS